MDQSPHRPSGPSGIGVSRHVEQHFPQMHRSLTEGGCSWQIHLVTVKRQAPALQPTAGECQPQVSSELGSMFTWSAGMPDFLAVCSTTVACRDAMSGPLDRLEGCCTLVGCSRCCVASQGNICEPRGPQAAGHFYGLSFGCRALLLKQRGPRFLMKALQTSREGNRQLSGGILAILAGASTCGAVSAVSPHLQLSRAANSVVHMCGVPSAHCWRVLSHACLLS